LSPNNETGNAGKPRNRDPVVVFDDRTDEAAGTEAPISKPEGDLGDSTLVTFDPDSARNDGPISTANVLDTLSADMRQGLRAPRGSIRLSVLPWAMVSVDDSSVGTTPLAGPITLAAGDYMLRLENPGFPAVTRSVRVVAGEEQNLDIVLWKTVNRVLLKVVPWAEVSVDGVVRDTVQTLSSPLILSPGPHSIVLRHPAFTERTIRHISIAGSIDTLSVNLSLPAN
jgi:hypothetical protein